MSLTPAALKKPRRKVFGATMKNPPSSSSHLCVFASLRETPSAASFQ